MKLSRAVSLEIGVEMKLKVLLFANYKELLGLSELTVELDTGKKVIELNQYLSGRGERWQELFQSASIKVAINHEIADLETVLHDGDEVAYFPPVTGG